MQIARPDHGRETYAHQQRQEDTACSAALLSITSPYPPTTGRYAPGLCRADVGDVSRAKDEQHVLTFSREACTTPPIDPPTRHMGGQLKHEYHLLPQS
jgi:hypothetical protein